MARRCLDELAEILLNVTSDNAYEKGKDLAKEYEKRGRDLI